MAEPRDAYARLPFQSDRTQRARDTGGGLTFFDVADWAANVDTVAGYLREVPLDLIARPAWVLARWGPESQGWPPAAEAADALQTRLVEMGSVATAGVIVFEVAATPAIVWSARIEGRTGHEPVLLARARAVEMEAFLQWGHALWRPGTYHYVLPSRKHTSTFIRLADAFQDDRAAAALATWLYEALNPEAPTTVVMDIGTLMPVVGELRRAAERQGSRLGLVGRHRRGALAGPVPVNQPGTPHQPAPHAAGQPDARAHIRERQRRVRRTAVERPLRAAEHRRCASSSSCPDSNPARLPSPRIPHLLSRLPGWASASRRVLSPTVSPAACAGTSARARLVTINPRAMSALVLPEPDLIVPDIFDARRNASVWEAYSRLPDDAFNLAGPTGDAPTTTTVGACSRRVDLFRAGAPRQDVSGNSHQRPSGGVRAIPEAQPGRRDAGPCPATRAILWRRALPLSYTTRESVISSPTTNGRLSPKR